MNLVLLHGYGVRSFFWEPMQTVLNEHGIANVAPDLDMASVEDGLRQISDIVAAVRENRGEPVTLVGHSLGGVLAALAGKRMGPSAVARVVVLSSPFGRNRRGPLAPLLRLALATGLLPPDAVRPRFFGPAIPTERQRALFDRAVREQPGLRSLPWQREWFHSRSFPNGLEQPSVVIASAADRVVPAAQTRAFAAAIGAVYHEFPASEQIGHDDLGVSTEIARRVVALIRSAGH